MTNQTAFAHAEFTAKKKSTRRERFFARIQTSFTKDGVHLAGEERNLLRIRVYLCPSVVYEWIGSFQLRKIG